MLWRKEKQQAGKKGKCEKSFKLEKEEDTFNVRQCKRTVYEHLFLLYGRNQCAVIVLCTVSR